MQPLCIALIAYGEFCRISRKYLNFAGPRPREISEALIRVQTMENCC